MLNPIERSVFANLFASLCEEMGAALGRAAFSPNIKDRHDYSCALFDAAGRLVGQACHIPVHLGAMAYAVAEVVNEYPLAEGDMLVLNDPFRGGTHLPDLTVIGPVHCNGSLVGYVANRAHHADIGGKTPGSMPLARHIEDEGLLISPARLFIGYQYQSQVVAAIQEQCRNPAERAGDLRAQIAAIETGRRRLQLLVETYGAPLIATACEALFETAATYMRAAIEDIPRGSYTFTDQLDGDGLGAEPLPIVVTVTVSAASLTVDFTGTAKPCAGNVNAPPSVTASAVLYALRCLLPDECPSNGGLFEPVELVIPEDCLLSARYPHAVAAGNVETSQRVVDVILGALARACPERIPAASCGSMNNVAIGAEHFAYYETIGGGAGAHPECAGRSAVHTHMTNTLNTPIESLERHYPLRVRRYQIRRGSGGRGSHSGGDGVVRELEALAPCTLSLLTERRTGRPYGLAGGEAGARGVNVLVGTHGDQRTLPGKGVFRLDPGQRIRIETPGGGGYGPFV